MLKFLLWYLCISFASCLRHVEHNLQDETCVRLMLYLIPYRRDNHHSERQIMLNQSHRNTKSGSVGLVKGSGNLGEALVW